MYAAKARSPLAHGPSSAEWNQAHEALKADAALWRILRFEGLQPDGAGGLFEVRTCPSCQSTILQPVSRERALELCEQQQRLHAQSLEALNLSPHLCTQAVALCGGLTVQP